MQIWVNYNNFNPKKCYLHSHLGESTCIVLFCWFSHKCIFFQILRCPTRDRLPSERALRRVLPTAKTSGRYVLFIMFVSQKLAVRRSNPWAILPSIQFVSMSFFDKSKLLPHYEWTKYAVMFQKILINKSTDTTGGACRPSQITKIWKLLMRTRIQLTTVSYLEQV